MNNFEKRLFIDYTLKLINEFDYTTCQFDNFFDSFLSEFKVNRKKFPTDADGNILTLTHAERNNFKKVFYSVLKNLQENIPVKNTTFEKKILLFKDIFELDDDEYVFLTYFIIKELNNVFSDLFDSLDNSTPFRTFARCVLKIKNNRQTRRLLNNLYFKNLIDCIQSPVINSDILRIFDDENCNTSHKIISNLIGKSEKSTLFLSDYNHIKSDRIKVMNILKAAVDHKQKGINILLYGYVGTGKTEFAKLIANSAKIPIYSVKTEINNSEEADRGNRLLDLYSKQQLLSRTCKACILFDEAEDVMNRGFSVFGNASKGYLNKILEETPVPVIWTTNNIYDVDPAFLRRMCYAVEFEKLSDETRLNIWNRVLKKNKFKVKKSKIEELNKTYNVSPSIISNAVMMTKLTSGGEDDFEGYIENITKVVYKKKNIKNTNNFDANRYNISLVNTDLSVDNLTAKIKSCGKLNFSICMYGEPGTGKSEYSKYLADKLGIEVIHKKASDLISMYVGQTEQNIAEAFLEAKSRKAMLIFDEADSFLQNRINATRSWEISQVNEMLTWMEKHEYPFICTTNLLDTLDEASLRRFTFKIKFDFMTNKQVNLAMKHFFDIDDANLNIKGLTTGDFATVKKKADFLDINDKYQLEKMLRDEVKLKQSKTLKNVIGF